MDERPLTRHEEIRLGVAKYRYARVFLEYLDTAKKLLLLQNQQEDVKPARDLIRNGRVFNKDYTDISIAMERALNSRRNIYKALEDLAYPVGRFDADVEIAKENESYFWERLVEAVHEVPYNDSWKEKLWYQDNMLEQRFLLIADEYSADRIAYYQRELKDTLYYSTPSPDALEFDFRLGFGKMAQAAPFML